MKARYCACRGVLAAFGSAGGLRATRASLGGASRRRVHESPGERPTERTCLRAVPVPDEPDDVLRESRHTVEAAVAQDATLKDAKPDLDLVDPGRMQRRVDEAESTTVFSIEPRPPPVASVVVHVEIVPDHVHPAVFVALRERVHEG